MAPAEKPEIRRTDLIFCQDLDAWMNTPKRVEETLSFTTVDSDNGTSQWVPLIVDDYRKSCEFRLRLEKRHGNFYVEIQHKNLLPWGSILVAGSSHPQQERVYIDQCCKESIHKNEGYVKRRAQSCTHKWGRETVRKLTTTDPARFYRDAAQYLSAALPDTPVVFDTRIDTLDGVG